MNLQFKSPTVAKKALRPNEPNDQVSSTTGLSSCVLFPPTSPRHRTPPPSETTSPHPPTVIKRAQSHSLFSSPLAATPPWSTSSDLAQKLFQQRSDRWPNSFNSLPLHYTSTMSSAQPSSTKLSISSSPRHCRRYSCRNVITAFPSGHR